MDNLKVFRCFGTKQHELDLHMESTKSSDKVQQLYSGRCIDTNSSTPIPIIIKRSHHKRLIVYSQHDRLLSGMAVTQVMFFAFPLTVATYLSLRSYLFTEWVSKEV